MLKAQHCGCLKHEADHVDVMCFSIGLDSLHIAQFLQIVRHGHDNIQVDIKTEQDPIAVVWQFCALYRQWYSGTCFYFSMAYMAYNKH